MKQADIDWIKKICNEKQTKNVWAKRAQVMAKNIKPLQAACDGDGDIPFEALEQFVKTLVKKYSISVGAILTITDVTGGMTYHTGVTSASKDEGTKRNNWLFTVHADTMYEMYMKISLMAFVAVKQGQVEKRSKPDFGKEG